MDYSQPDWADMVREATAGAGADVVLDGVGGQIGRASFGVTAPGGRFLAFGVPGGGFTVIEQHEAQQHEVTVSSILELEWTPEDERRLPALALSEAADGRMTPVIGQTFPLQNAADAHTAIESRNVLGKTLLLI